jgi:kynurenine 3-monooxygenase
MNIGEWIVLLGDASHAVLPPVGEGINSGLEDSVVLA